MNLKRLLFEQITEDTTIEIENNIVDTFQRWLPFVDLRDIQINTDNNQVNVNITFSIKRASASLESVNVTLGGVGG